MKLILYLLLAVALFGADEARLSLQPPFERNLNYGSEQAGTLYVSFCQDSSNNNFGPILVWKSKDQKDQIEITDTASLDEMMQRELATLGATATNEQIIDTIVRILGVYVNVRNDRLLLVDPIRTKYLTALKQHSPNLDYTRLEPLFDLPKFKITSTTWEINFMLLTKRRGLERRFFSGTIRPFSITESKSVVLAPDGTFPEFAFMP